MYFIYCIIIVFLLQIIYSLFSHNSAFIAPSLHDLMEYYVIIQVCWLHVTAIILYNYSHTCRTRLTTCDCHQCVVSFKPHPPELIN